MPNTGSYYSAQSSLTTAGTAQPVVTQAQMAALTPSNPTVSQGVIKAAKANTAPVYIGGVGVTAANGFELDAGDDVVIEDCNGFTTLYFNGTVVGSVVSVLMRG